MPNKEHGPLFNGVNYLIYGDDTKIYFWEFYDWEEIDSDLRPIIEKHDMKVYGYVGESAASGFHACNKSRIWDEIPANYVDVLQNERNLPDENYVVIYYVCDENLDLLQYVDFGITKSQIVANVEAQKYMEGAEYYPINLMREFVK